MWVIGRYNMLTLTLNTCDIFVIIHIDYLIKITQIQFNLFASYLKSKIQILVPA